MLSALLEYEPYEVVVTTYQAISGAGKTFAEWPEMVDNIIPFISGEEEKSEMEPLHIWGSLKNGVVTAKEGITITTQCVRVPVTDGHTACVFVKFRNKPTKEQILTAWKNYRGLPQELQLPSAPEQFITYFEEDNRPQAKLDRDLYGGMGVSAVDSVRTLCMITSLSALHTIRCAVPAAVQYLKRNVWQNSVILTLNIKIAVIFRNEHIQQIGSQRKRVREHTMP